MGTDNPSSRSAVPGSQSEWIEKLARFGYASKGAVYIIVGGLALAGAFMAGSQITGSKGALVFLAGRPFGQVMLGIVGLGLLAYAGWRFVQAVKNPEGAGSDARGKLKRAGQFLSGILYVSLAFTAWTIVFGSGGASSSGEGSTQTWTGRLMAQPFGRWLVALVGLGVAAFALREFHQAWSTKFMKRIRTWEMEPETSRWVRVVGRMGHAARGVVFLIVGFFLLVAAWNYNPGEARGLEGALRTLQEQPYGPWLLALTGLGLLAYGVFQLVNARFRAINPGPIT